MCLTRPTVFRMPRFRSGGWYELDLGDATVIPALLVCDRVSAITTQELAQRGFDGKIVPEFNYTPSLGLYLIRPAPRPTPSP